MATASDARAVKSLDETGRKRFVFKTFTQQIEEVEIDVYRSLVPVKIEPSEGSSFFRDCLVEWRELNTAEDFISFYEESMPFVQTLPQIILHKELICTKLLSRLQINARLSLEPILRLIAALARDLLEDFLPFLQKLACSLVSLLKSGADREPEIIDQIFTSWSCIMMYLQKYLTRDIVSIVRITVKLRYYSKEYVQEFMAESVSFLLRNSPVEQLIKGIKRIMLEVTKKPVEFRKSGSSALLWYAMRGTSSKLHSRAGQVLRLLMDKSILGIGDNAVQDNNPVMEVVTTVFQRLCQELEPKELNLLWDCLIQGISESVTVTAVTNGSQMHLSRLLSLLVTTIEIEHVKKLSDFKPFLQLIEVLIRKFIMPSGICKPDDQPEVVNEVLQLMRCILDGLHLSSNMQIIYSLSNDWSPVFKLRNSSLLAFIHKLLLKDPSIIHAFKHNIISALSELLEDNEEEVILLLVIFCERIKVHHSSFLEEASKEDISKISRYLQKNVQYWIQTINDIVCGELEYQFQSSKLALLWAVISCYPYMIDIQSNSSLLLDFVDAVDQLLMTASGITSDFQCQTWEGLIGAALSSYNKLLVDNHNRDRDLRYFLQIVERHKLSPQILNSVADMLDSINGPPLEADGSNEALLPVELGINKSEELFCKLNENLSHPKKIIRLSTLRILCHIDPSSGEVSTKNQHHVDKTMITESSETFFANNGVNVLQLFLSIETTPLSVGSSRTIDLLISRIETALAAGNISDSFISSALYAIIGILHNRFTYLWDPALKCLAVLISKHIQTTWDKFVKYLEHCLAMCLASKDTPDEGKSETTSSDLVERFNLFLSPSSDSSTPWMSVLSSLIQCLQKIPSLTESKSRQMVPLFLRFLGYNSDDVVCVWSFNIKACKGKDWKSNLKEWLQLFTLMRNPKCLYKGHFLKEIMQHRLLDDNDYEIQIKVLDCLLNWKDSSLLPYDQHLKKLICSKNLREELTTWSLSKESKLIEDHHRTYLVPLVIQILMPKVRKLKTLASRKHKSLNHRKAVLGFLSHVDINELVCFFALLLKPLLNISPEIWFEEISKWSWDSSERLMHNADVCSILKYFTEKNILSLSWKKRNGFLHVIEDILGVFDELHIKPYLDLLMGSVIRILWSCTVSIDCWKNSRLTEDETISEADGYDMTSTSVKQLKDIRTLCLKIISFSLNKYEDHDYGSGFWDMFFASVKPLIDGFKLEGASSEKPSSLFSCFLAMSSSHKLVYLLHKENNLVPDIFSMLNVKTASEAIVSCVLKFVQNLLTLDNELDEGDDAIKRVLLPNLDVLVCSLHRLFRSSTVTRKLVKSLGERELRILKPLLKYIKDPSAAKKFVDILLPLLAKGIKNSDACIEALEVIRQLIPILNDDCTRDILSSVPSLLISSGQDVRLSICDLLDVLAERDSSVIPVAKLIHELNATSTTEVGSLDYDVIIGAYENIRSGFFQTVREEHALIFLSHAVHDMSSEELILRQSAYSLLLSFVEFSAEIIGVKKLDGCWTEACIHKIVNKFLLKHMGDAMTKESSVQKIWLDLLREMVLKLPTVHILEPFKALCNEDAEQDFFKNVLHLQRHRRARALTKFKNFADSGNLSEAVLSKIFIPLFFAMLFDVQDGKAEHLKNACVEALASVSVNMKWQSYFTFLNKCFRELVRRPDRQKILFRLICYILDHFHFTEGPIVQEADFSAMDVSKPGMDEATYSTKSIDISEIHSCLQKSILPKIQKLVRSDSVDVNTNLVMLKLLKLLPIDVLEVQLPSIMHRISNFLKHRLESIRDEARIALAACLKELGLDYLLFVVKTVKSILRRGYELHVLGYTLHFLLSKHLATPTIGRLDYCLEELLSVAVNDILGDVSEQKEVDKIASKMKETRKVKSFETLMIISQNVTFKTHALKMLSPITARLQKHMTPKLKVKLENMLSNIAVGFESNPSVNQTDLFIFIYSLIEDGINSENHKHATAVVKPNQASEDEINTPRVITQGRLIDAGRQCSHLVTVFALRMLQNRLKNNKADRREEQLLAMLDPFVRLLSDCLNSKYEDVMSSSLRCLVPLLSLPLPSIESQADKIKMSLLVIAQGSLNASSPLTESCLKLLTVLLQSTSITLSTDQLHMLIQFPVFVDLERNPSFVALSLLKAIIRRKLVVHEIYDVVTCVAELMVTSQVEPIRKKCSQILLQFLLDYHLSETRLQQHLDFLLSNLRYEHSEGREAVLELLHAIIVKFPKDVIDEHSHMIFVHLVVCLANDHDSKVRSMTGAAIKLLIGHVSSRALDSILEFSLSWYSGEKQQLWSAAAQVLGLLVEVMKKGFGRYNDTILSMMKVILQSSMKACENKDLGNSDEASIPMWKEAYYSLIMFEKMLHQFQDLCLASKLEDIWNIICELLWHPHMWLRNISNRLVAIYFNSVADATSRGNNERPFGTYFLTTPSKLFLVASSLCSHLKSENIDNATGSLITQNAVFAICGIHSLMGERQSMNFDTKENEIFLKAFQLLESGKGRTEFATIISGDNMQENGDHQSPLVVYLLKRMGNVAIQMESIQMKIVFNIFTLLAKKITSQNNVSADTTEHEKQSYVYQLLLPIYKVCEGFSGRAIQDEIKLMAQESLESIRDTLGMHNFVQVYNVIRKDLKENRDKRKREEKLMAVVNPMRNAKRKLRLAAKSKANKKRKVTSLKLTQWMR
ncbi:small subunit processome component 20 homolog [Impatiens glandulifera]|uniref:small subunit processome component 20 homolog n=1 Tax=Impatiens glandulifera TaxID=253017 RepID=UPI001FB15C19|nr:small subunit processome component 20 homolog [Impatiens glandulifera]